MRKAKKNMEIEHIEQVIHRIIEGLTGQSLLYDNDKALSDFGVDSLQAVELILRIESAFNFEFSSEDLSYRVLKNVKSIANYVYERLNRRPS